MSEFDNINDNTVQPLPVTIQGDDTDHTLGNIVLGIIAIGALYSMYSERKRRKHRDAIHAVEMKAAENYEKQTGIQAKTARVEYEATCEKHGVDPERSAEDELREKMAARAAEGAEEMRKMLNGDTEAIVRNLPETEETTA